MSGLRGYSASYGKQRFSEVAWIRERIRCFFSLFDARRSSNPRWHDITDNAIHSGPWLCRETGKAFRRAALCSFCAIAIPVSFPQGGSGSRDTAYFCSLGSILSFAAILERQQDSVQASLFYCSLMPLGKTRFEWNILLCDGKSACRVLL